MHKKIKIGKSVLETITVALYENPIILFREYVQNSLDAYNRARDNGEKIIKDFHVAINIDEKCKKIVITDNGYGIKTNALFNNRMLSIGASDKVHDRTKYIGFRGIGRISGLPFCKKLTFRNKAKNSNKIQICTWEGEKYRNLLDKEDTKGDLESIIKKIITFEEENISHEKTSEHFFEVVLEGYSEEIKGMTGGETKFRERLIRMLPLRYKDNFKGAKEIATRYKSFMNESMERFIISVKYNGKDLFKTYDDKFILGSGIRFWEIRGRQKQDGSIGDKTGLLWFTFDKHLKSNNDNEYYGILTRSKNVLMGTNDTFARVVDDSKMYVTTFREMVQSLQGIYGELLINSSFLKDNSRRDWFLPDRYSMDLSNAITDFMQRLHNYRYCASRYFRAKPSREKEDLKKALDELVDIKDHQIDYDYFYKREIQTEEEIIGEFSQDIPHENQSMKKCYDILMKVIERFFNKTRKRVLFLKLRAYIVNHFKKK